MKIKMSPRLGGSGNVASSIIDRVKEDSKLKEKEKQLELSM